MNKSTGVTIVGSGLGALSTALRLTYRGYKVRIIEKNKEAGGRLCVIKDKGYQFDGGPSFFSMSYEFDELAQDSGIVLPFIYERVDPLYSVTFDKNKQFVLYRDLKKTADQFNYVEENSYEKLKEYLKHGEKIFRATIDPIVKNNHLTVLEYIRNLLYLPPSLTTLLFRNFWDQVGIHFKSEEMKQVMSLVAFFLGETPFKTNSVYSLLSFTEFCHDGYYNVRGGMYKIIEGFVSILRSRGVDFIFNREIVDIEETAGKIVGVIDKEGTVYKDDIFVVNSDAALFRGRVLGRKSYSDKRLEKMRWTFAPLTIYLGLKKKVDLPFLHNYFLGDNYHEYAARIFEGKSLDEHPYFYVNILSKYNPECAPRGHEALFIVCPMPDLRFKKDWSDSEQIVNSILKEFENKTGEKIIESIDYLKVYTPEDWQEKFNLYKGSGLGLAHSLDQVGYFRPKNKDEKYRNLFYVGASTTPGTGLPMCVIGSKLITHQIDHLFHPY